MPVHASPLPSAAHLSTHTVALCFGCLAATFLGVSLITLSLLMIMTAHAGSPEYWSIAAILLLVWLLSLIRMLRMAVVSMQLER